MAAQELVKNLPENARRGIYVGFALVGVALGATVTGFSTAEIAQPVWLEVAGSIYLYIGGAFGITAAVNVGAKRAVEVDETPAGADYEPQHRADNIGD